MSSSPDEKAEGAASNEEQERLRDLAQHALELADQLAQGELRFREERAERRRLEAELSNLFSRVNATEGLMADFRRRLRDARRLSPPRPATQASVALEVVVFPWLDHKGEVVAPDPEDLAAVLQVCNQAEEPIPCTLLCPSGLPVADYQSDGLQGLHLIDTDNALLSTSCNFGMATGTADAVLFVAAGCRLEGDLGRLQLPVDESLVGCSPLAVLSSAKGETTECLGLEESDHLHLQRRDAKAGEPDSMHGLGPEGFLLFRAAYHALGPFDQDLLGPHGLHEYCLRARVVGFRLAELPGLRVKAGAVDLLAQRGVAGDRLATLARHRSNLLMPAWVADRSFWEEEPEERARFIRALLTHVGGGGEGVALEVLVEQAQALARSGVVPHELQGDLAALEASLRRLHGVPVQRDTELLHELFDKLESRQDQVAQACDPHTVLQGFCERVALETQAKMELHRVADGFRRQLEEHKEWVEKFRGDNEKLALQISEGQSERESLLEQQQRALDDVHRAGEKLAEQEETIARLRRREEEQSAQIASLRSELERVSGQAAETTFELERANAAAAAEQETAKLAEHRRAEVQGQLAEVEAQLAELRETMHDRDRWIVLLLEETSRRRLRLLPRGLQPHETAFIDKFRNNNNHNSDHSA